MRACNYTQTSVSRSHAHCVKEPFTYMPGIAPERVKGEAALVGRCPRSLNRGLVITGIQPRLGGSREGPGSQHYCHDGCVWAFMITVSYLVDLSCAKLSLLEAMDLSKTNTKECSTGQRLSKVRLLI